MWERSRGILRDGRSVGVGTETLLMFYLEADLLITRQYVSGCREQGDGNLEVPFWCMIVVTGKR